MKIICMGLFAGAIGCASIPPVSAAEAANVQEAVVYSFASGKDGAAPEASLIDVEGTLYGTTYGGGGYDEGTVFSVNCCVRRGDGARPFRRSQRCRESAGGPDRRERHSIRHDAHRQRCGSYQRKNQSYQSGGRHVTVESVGRSSRCWFVSSSAGSSSLIGMSVPT
jgi:uncharacterized repeat protein (TIGR03803 family)